MHVLIVDDHDNIRRSLRALLESEGWTVSDVDRAERALTDLDALRPDVVLLDLALPGMNGLDALARLRERAPALPVVMMSGQAALSDAVEATRRGAFHFIEKPITPESVLLTLRRALELGRARDLTRALQRELGPGTELVGTSPALVEVRRRVERVAATDARVLITGESGTGKELVAAAIHGLSARREGPFVRVNSAALPDGLVESEMFGHEKGSFTGATERRLGRFELASGGTLFLDEVGDLGAEAQAKLLRALESGVIERVGGTTKIAVDVRVLAATNRDLARRVEEGAFREDLLFRLEVVPIHLPPLRDRREDIEPLLQHAVQRLRTRQGIRTPRFEADAVAVLRAHAWPGNVRELFNVVERLAILHGEHPIDREAAETVLATGRRTRPATPSASPPALAGPRSLREQLDAYERTLLQDALDRAGGNMAEAARLLRTDRANLYRRLTRLGLRTDGSVSE
ncbi:MAG: sigma-54 dependent transcriptional regulator [Gemmatimonadota bacterium]